MPGASKWHGISLRQGMLFGSTRYRKLPCRLDKVYLSTRQGQEKVMIKYRKRPGKGKENPLFPKKSELFESRNLIHIKELRGPILIARTLKVTTLHVCPHFFTRTPPVMGPENRRQGGVFH